MVSAKTVNKEYMPFPPQNLGVFIFSQNE
jgi:hypothetical protein